MPEKSWRLLFISDVIYTLSIIAPRECLKGSLDWKKGIFDAMTEKEINVVRVLCVAYFFLNEREFGLMVRHCINSYPGVAWVTHIALVILTLMTKVCGPFNLARTYLSIVLLCQFNGNSFVISVSDWRLANPVWTTLWPSFAIIL